jgi:hypothetical protein
MTIPCIPGVLPDGHITRFYGCDVRELLPLMLQADVAECREEHAGRRTPTYNRTLEGCEHAILKKTGASHDEVRRFMDVWYASNADILQLVYEAVQKEPVQNYFR